jgi:glycosyltransferase involved in cell wall biosynthesis
VRVVYLTVGYAPDVGGIERHVEEIARRTAAAGHQAQVLTQSWDSRLPAHEVRDGVEILRFRSINRSRAYGVAPGLFAHVARRLQGADLVHAHGYHALPSLSSLLARRTPVVFTPHYHGTGHTTFGRLLHLPYDPIGRSIFRRARAVICVSDAERRLVARDIPAVARRIEVIPNGVDTVGIRAAEAWPATAPLVLSIGRLLPYKRVDRLIAALPHLPASTRLTVVGSGPMAGPLARQVDEAGLGARVTFAGKVDDEDLRRWLRSASVVASMSLEEAYGLVLAEGLAAGAAVVASAIPAHEEVLAGQPLGVLTPVDADPPTVARAIARGLALHREPHPAPVVHGWDEVAGQTIELYERVVR